MESANTIEDDFHINLTEPVDLEELCKLDGKGSEFEVCLPEDLKEKEYFDSEDVFKQLNYEVNNEGNNESGDEELTPFERIIRRMEAVTPDGGVMKNVIKVGSGNVIGEGSTATVHYNGYFEYCDEPYDSTRLRNKPLILRLGAGRGIEGLEIAVSTMRKGELSQFLVKPQYGFGVMGVPPRIPENSTILYEIEMLNMSENPVLGDFDNWSTEKRKTATFAETLQVANSARQAGNNLFREKHVSKAMYQYGKAIKLLEDVRLADQSEEDDMKHVSLKLYLNMALCCIKQCQSTRTLSYCTKALDIDPKCVKAMYRRGQALLQISEFDRAQTWLSRAQKHCPNDVSIVKELARLHVLRTKFQRLERSRYSKMFSSSSSKGTTNDGDQSGVVAGKDDKSGSKPKKCPVEVQELFTKRLKAFKEDEDLVEMPFALDTLTTAETEYIQQAAEDMGLQVRKLHQKSDKYLKIFKPQPETDQ